MKYCLHVSVQSLVLFLFTSGESAAFVSFTQQLSNGACSPVGLSKESIRATYAVSPASSSEVLPRSALSNSNDGNPDQIQPLEGVEDPTETYEICLKLGRLATKCASRKHSQGAAMEALQLLKNMTYPDTVAYNSVLKAFAKTSPAKVNGKSAAEYAQKLLEEMITVHQQQNRDNQDWYERNAQGTLSEAELSQGPTRVRVKPNVRSFSTVIDAWARIGEVELALSVLNHLESRYETSGYDVALQPNTIAYNTVLSAYAKSHGGLASAEQAQDLLEEMLSADVISYNSVLMCWARSGAPDAGERAETLLRQMPIRPNARSYTAVMDAWSKSKSDIGDGSTAAERAYALLEELRSLYQRTGDETLRPNCHCWSTVIHAYAVSKEPFKAQRAYELLQEMRELGRDDPSVLPNRITYNSVLNACATSSPLAYSDREHSETCLRDMVQTLYDQLTQRDLNDGKNSRYALSPDCYTFGTLLKACGNNIFWDNPSFCIKVFQDACDRGQVSFGVIFQLRQAVPMDVLHELLPEEAYDHTSGQFSMARVPASWKRNVWERDPTPRNKSGFKSNKRAPVQKWKDSTD